MWKPCKLIVLLFSAIVANSAGAAAETTISALVNAGAFGILNETRFNNVLRGDQSWSGSASFSSPYPTAPGSGVSIVAAVIDFGVLKVSSSSSCSGGCGTTGNVAVSFSDSFSIDRPDLHGQIGFLTTTVEYFWTGTVVNSEVISDGNRFASIAQADVGFLLSGVGIISADELAVAGGVGTPPRLQVSDLFGTLQDLTFSWRAQVTTPFAFGNELSFLVSLSADTYAGGAYGPDGSTSLGARASLAADRSAYWGGISVSLADGTVISDYSLASESGVDWRQSFVPSPVPELGSFMLLSIGLITLPILTRKRRSASCRRPELSPSEA